MVSPATDPIMQKWGDMAQPQETHKSNGVRWSRPQLVRHRILFSSKNNTIVENPAWLTLAFTKLRNWIGPKKNPGMLTCCQALSCIPAIYGTSSRVPCQAHSSSGGILNYSMEKVIVKSCYEFVSQLRC
ncbi:unnamed protein product [Urochloa humidicola]